MKRHLIRFLGGALMVVAMISVSTPANPRASFGLAGDIPVVGNWNRSAAPAAQAAAYVGPPPGSRFDAVVARCLPLRATRPGPQFAVFEAQYTARP